MLTSHILAISVFGIAFASLFLWLIKSFTKLAFAFTLCGLVAAFVYAVMQGTITI